MPKWWDDFKYEIGHVGIDFRGIWQKEQPVDTYADNYVEKSEDNPYKDLKVYVVEKEHYQASEVVAVFDTADKARAYCEEKNKTIDPYLKSVRLSGYEYNEWEVR